MMESDARSVASYAMGQLDNFQSSYVSLAPRPGGKSINELYRLRSKLSHGNLLLGADEEEGFLAFANPIHNAQQQMWERATTTTRIALVNWLLRAGSAEPLAGPEDAREKKVGYLSFHS